ncbi:MAG: M6 family metalloprotease domain-containing protein [Prevotella sp.]|nr:M6 family metalloprotease domain-containing protein [Prevotella sp.]
MISKRHYIAIFLLVVCQIAMAAPAMRGVYKTLRLSDGREIRAMLVGDEFGSFWRGDDGRAYVPDGDCYVPANEKAIVAQANARRALSETKTARRLATRRASNTKRYLGEKKCLVILVNFANKAFQTTHDRGLFQRILNEEHFEEPPFKGSVADYFRDQSRGQFQVSFDVVGPVTLSERAAYYGCHSPSKTDANTAEMVIEAVESAKAFVDDWQQYDWDGDGLVDQVYLIYAGKSESESGDENDVWAHKGELSTHFEEDEGTGPVEVSPGLFVDIYACSSELHKSGEINGIGMMCHEFSHCLGLSDLYDTENSGGQGMQYWDLMHYGEYLSDGYLPSGYSSFERWMLGWMEPTELTNDTTVTNLKSLQNDGESYIIYNKGNRNEYFLLENRQYDKWDGSLPGQGLLILHVDYDADDWAGNKPNSDYRHQRMTLVPADGQFKAGFNGTIIYYDQDDLSTDAFPQPSVTAFNRSFMTYDAQAERAAKLFNMNTDGSYLIDSSVEAITQNDDGTIAFNFVTDYTGEAAVKTPETIDLATLTENYIVRDGSTLTGTLNANVQVSIENGATVTLDGVTILGASSYSCQWAGLTCMGDATLILASGTENTVRGFYAYYPGINAPWDHTLTIKGDGSLTASSNGYAPGIGSSVYSDCGNIRIEGGTITATGGDYAAAIGGAYRRNCGNITITTGVTSVTAIAGSEASSIGKGYEKFGYPNTCGTITIGGVKTGSIKESPFTYIPTSVMPLIVRPESGSWHTLDGRRLMGKPTAKGVYINDGQIIIIR